MTQQYELLVKVTSTSLNTKYKEINPTVEQIEEELKIFSNIFKVTEEEYKKASKTLNSKLIHKISFATTLKGENSEHIPWYNKSKFDNFYWKRYNDYLKFHKHWSPEIVKRINETSDEVMSNLGDPKSENPFQRRGLILGDVQSGKTANYTAICNKAVDSGYKIIIVLAGMMENLRVQTQERLDAEFVGKTSKYLLDVKYNHILNNRNIGVSEIEPNKDNNQITCFTSVDTDFRLSIIKAVNLGINNLNGAALFVVKKNKSILTNLHNWLKSNNINYTSGLIDLPVLIIDDESDNASINTNSEDKDPTAINKAIRDILHLFQKASYIGITATPFANIFINVDENDKIAEDLFPKDFITLLPSPEKYIGAEKIFGKADMEEWYDIKRSKYLGEYKDSIISISNEEQAPYFAYKHKKEIANNLSSIPQSLETAIRYFILVCAISDFRRDEKSHRSMLVNVSRFTDVQNITTDIIKELLSDIKYSIESFSSLPTQKAIQSKEILELYKVWQNFNLEKKSQTSWENILHKFLWSSSEKIHVIAVNQTNGSKALDYDKYKDYGKRVIAVGGNSLSRGITLEGLCVSYFYRNTMMYDTLLQMGRWFGYRPNYNDLFKIWMGEDSIDWYGYISDAVNELKNEIKSMNRLNQTPSDFGLKVRQAPCSLIVTARNKMRNGTAISRPISVSGRLIETPRLFSCSDILLNNEITCKTFLNKIENITSSDESFYDKNTNAYLWKNIPKDEIVNLLQNFKSHPWNLNFQSSALAKYIEETSPDLDIWDVGIPFGKSDNEYNIQLNEKKLIIKPEQRSIKKDITIKDMIKVSGRHVRVGSGGCSKIGLSKEKLKNIQDNKKLRTDKDYLIAGRHPILLIHVLENKEPKEVNIPKYIFALSLGFPGGQENKTAVYIVNTKELQSYIDIEEVIYDEDN